MSAATTGAVAAATSAVAAVIASSSDKKSANFQVSNFQSYFGGNEMKIISFILIAVMGLYIIRTSVSIYKTIKERKRAREPSIESEGKEESEDDNDSD